MSGNALKKLGIDAAENNPSNGVLVKLTPKTFLQVKQDLQPILAAVGDTGRWTTGGAGSWDPEHPFAHKGTTKIESGDVDVFMDSDKIKRKLKMPATTDDKTVRKVLADRMAKYYPTTQIGTNVHIGFPTGGEVNGLPTYFQIDLMTMQNAGEIARHHEHDYSIKDTPYKGVDQQLALASLINSIPGHPPKTFQYHGFGGALKNRATGEVVTRDIDKIADMVLGPGHSSQDLGNVESIIAAVGGINSPRLAQFRDDMAKKYPQLTEGSVDWFKSIKQKLAI